MDTITSARDSARSSAAGTSKQNALARMTDLPTGRSGISLNSESKKISQSGNPFKMPNDNDIFALRDAERQRKKQERSRQKHLKVHEKLPAIHRITVRDARMITNDSDQEDEEARPVEEKAGGMLAVKEDPQFVVSVTRDRNVEKETLSEYINKKREMFLLQYSLGVKRGEMRKLEDIASAEEKKLELAEKYLEEDAAMFDEFLKENDKNSVEAIKIAEEEAKAKLSKVSEIKRLNTNLMQIKSEINKYIDQLKEYRMYKEFLDRLLPDEEKARRRERHEVKKKFREALETAADGETSARKSKAATEHDRASVSSETESDRIEKAMEGFQSDEDDLDELYFTDPQQLLLIFTELEESNLSLIQNCQETEEQIEEMKQAIEATESKMKRETSVLEEQIDKLNKAIEIEVEKIEEFKLKSKMFSYGDYQAEDQEKILSELHKKVEEVYRSCIADTGEATQTTLQMLTSIENRIEELFETIELLPQDKVELAQKAKEKERRLKLKEEKKEQQKLHQEERIRKALERAKEPPKKQTGRRIVGRSEPPRMKKKDDGMNDKQSREEEEFAYFFT